MDRDDTLQTKDQRRVVLVTGPSGAGRSTAINVLEDLDYEVIDNIPLSIIPKLLDASSSGRPLVLGLDVRNRDFSVSGLIELVDSIGSNEQFEATQKQPKPESRASKIYLFQFVRARTS